MADEQVAGRGRRGRTWTSPPGVNLMCSVAAPANLAARDAGLLGAAVALAVVESARPVGRARPCAGRTTSSATTAASSAACCVETAVRDERLTSAVIGIGLNVNWRLPRCRDEIRDGATSLARGRRHRGRPGGAPRLASSSTWRGRSADLEAGLTPLPRLRRRSWLDGHVDRRSTPADGLVHGIGAGLADDGSLLLDTDAGRIALGHGEVVRVWPRGVAGMIPRPLPSARPPAPPGRPGRAPRCAPRSAIARAFDVLYRRYLDRVYAYAFYALGDHHDAEDATERTFMGALRGHRRLPRERGRVPGLALPDRPQHGRERAPHARTTSCRSAPRGMGSARPNADPAALVARAEEARRVLRAIRALPEDRRQVILLRFVDGLTSARSAQSSTARRARCGCSCIGRSASWRRGCRIHRGRRAPGCNAPPLPVFG